MAGLKSNALISVAEYKVLTEIDEDDIGSDASIEAFINYASQYIEDETGRKFITPDADIDEYFDGDNTDTFNTKYWPLTAAITQIFFLSDNDWTTELTGISLSTNLDLGELQFTDGNRFMEVESISNYYKISYSYGYSLNNVPQDLKMACASVAATRRTQFNNRTHGVSSRSIGNQSTAYDPSIDQYAIDIINSYKRRH